MPTPDSSPTPSPSTDDSHDELPGDLVYDTGNADLPDEILDRAHTLDWDHAYALVSGGRDSTAAFHYTYHNAAFPLDGIIYIRTDAYLVEAEEYVRDLADEYGVEFHVADERGPEADMLTRVPSYGFAGPTQTCHRVEWQNQKDKPLMNLLRGIDGKPLLVSGASREESRERYEAVSENGIENKGNHIYVSPLAGWTAVEIQDYLEENGVELSEVVTRLGSSGDCWCGAFSDRWKDLNVLNEHYPYLRTYIQSLEAHAIDAARNGAMEREDYEQYVLWAHGRDREFEQFFDDEQPTIGQACRECKPAAPGPLPGDNYQTATEAALGSDLFRMSDTPTAYRDRFSVLDALPDDPSGERSQLAVLRDGYDALRDVATKLGYDSLDNFIEAQRDEREIAREYIRDEYPELSQAKEEKLIDTLEDEGAINN